MPGMMGWIPPEQRTKAQHKAHATAVGSMPHFFIAAQTIASQGQRVVLWDAAKKISGGKHLPTLYQQQGSCVEQGKTNALMYVECVEILNGDLEEFKIPSLYHGYGWTRYYSGMSGRGDGAMGSGAAQAAREAGVCPIDGVDDLPKPTINQDGDDSVLIWGGDNEYKYSTYKAVPDDANQLAKKHLIKSTALVKTYEMVRDAIVNGYPVTVASNRGFKMTPKVDRGKSWGIPSGSWNHQMCFIGIDDDPSRPGAYCMNSWGLDAHGKPADDAPRGGFWVDADTVTSMVGQGDSYAYSQFDGFPQQTLDFTLVG